MNSNSQNEIWKRTKRQNKMRIVRCLTPRMRTVILRCLFQLTKKSRKRMSQRIMKTRRSAMTMSQRKKQRTMKP